VDELCSAAGVTKGAFFHHFKGKDELGVAAAEYWSNTTGALFADAPYQNHADPLDRVIGSRVPQISSARRRVGVHLPCRHHGPGDLMVQETYETAPAIRKACNRSISGHAATLEADIEEARRARLGGVAQRAQGRPLQHLPPDRPSPEGIISTRKSV
jgi:TetR/AcrR family transcriptional repressor of nem operon